MKLLKGCFSNFGSYSSLEFNFDSLGLALAYGRTGSGKSTIPDMVSWTLFGVTAKDGAADQVRSWTASNEVTTGVLTVEVNGLKITVARMRGEPRENDLYWHEDGIDGPPIRGKDITDTQKLLEKRLGVTKDLFLTGAYFHEFSDTGNFFTAKAKDRRTVFEKIASLDLAIELGAKSSDSRKQSKRHLSELELDYAKRSGRHEQLLSSMRDMASSATEYERSQSLRVAEWEAKGASFERTKSQKLEALQLKSDAFEANKNTKTAAKVTELLNIEGKLKSPKSIKQHIINASQLGSCATCKQPLKEYQDKIDALRAQDSENERLHDKYAQGKSQLAEIVDSINPYLEQIEQAKLEVNTYAERAQEEAKKANPFQAQVAKLTEESRKALQLVTEGAKAVETAEKRVSDLTKLYDLSFELRGEMLKQAVSNAEASTNRYLEKFFDSEIRVSFALEGSDDLLVTIHKSGYECSYKQLSKGQRQLLKLSFVVSIMKAASNKAGVHFDNLFFDEALDGLDADLKVKAFAMLEELSTEHSSILVIDHAPEFQNLFMKRYHVTMEADNSSIETDWDE